MPLALNAEAVAEDGDVVLYVSSPSTDLAVAIRLDPDDVDDLLEDLGSALVAATAWRSAQVGADHAESLAESRAEDARLERTDPDNVIDPRRLP